MIAEIYSLLYSLGITANYKGFFHTSYSVYLVANQPERLQLATKLLYPEVAKHYKTTWKNVERNIRTVVTIAWDTNRPLLESMAQHPLSHKPSNTKFLAILATHFTPPKAEVCAITQSVEDDNLPGEQQIGTRDRALA